LPMVKNYDVYIPEVPGTIVDELAQCLKGVEGSLESGNLPVKLNIFINQPDYNSYLKAKSVISEKILETFQDRCPAFNITVHPPEHPLKVVIEATFVKSGSANVKTKFWKSIPYILIDSGPYREIWGAGLGVDHYRTDIRKAASAAFDFIENILSEESMTFDNIVRQWNYIGDILKVRNGYQNYQIFNEVRSEYYERFRRIKVYPAATGIGMKFGGVFLDFCALIAKSGLQIRALDNPNQVNAYDYGQQVLRGMIDKGKKSKHPPQFERALLIINETHKSLFISGTASIMGQETIGKGDIREQTLVTIRNINRLADLKRINQILGKDEALNGKYTLLRVYIKSREDFPEVRKICDEHFPEVPAIYVESDICRDDLLTEIEAEFLL
jgi:enamine deaminase RidA (YjgF/YER057c/UK114 family)